MAGGSAAGVKEINHMTNRESDSQASGIEEWDLTATNLFRIQQCTYEVAVLPVGAIEPHNRHLPLGQDCRHTTWVAKVVGGCGKKRKLSSVCRRSRTGWTAT